MSSEEANDVTKALAAFGAPSLRYHSFGHQRLKPAALPPRPTPLPSVNSAAPLPGPAPILRQSEPEAAPEPHLVRAPSVVPVTESAVPPLAPAFRRTLDAPSPGLPTASAPMLPRAFTPFSPINGAPSRSSNMTAAPGNLPHSSISTTSFVQQTSVGSASARTYGPPPGIGRELDGPADGETRSLRDIFALLAHVPNTPN